MGQKEAENMEMKILVICMIAIAQTFCETVNLIELRRSSPDSFSLTIKFEKPPNRGQINKSHWCFSTFPVGILKTAAVFIIIL